MLCVSWARINASLLCREQAEIIRATRTRLETGASGYLGERESLVAPGAKWRVTADSTSYSASFELTPRPVWTNDSDFGDQNHFLLPLDGSKAWIFRKREEPNGRLVSR